jgi:Holliday junction resolvasome RuvABC endonuclease subunit
VKELLAIDPASNKCGIAFFREGKLVATRTITSTAETPLARRMDIARQLQKVYYPNLFEGVVSEEPLLLGRNNNGMQRLLGYLELITEGKVSFIHPMTIKSKMGHGSKDKLEVALAAGEHLKTEDEKEIIADIIRREAFDESDAVAVGLVYLCKN